MKSMKKIVFRSVFVMFLAGLLATSVAVYASTPKTPFKSGAYWCAWICIPTGQWDRIDNASSQNDCIQACEAVCPGPCVYDF